MNYPEDYINKIIQGDCLEVMKGIPDNSVDLVVTDPPYNLDTTGGKLDRRKVNPLGWFEGDDMEQGEYKVFLNYVFSETSRVLKDNTALYVWIDFRTCIALCNMI